MYETQDTAREIRDITNSDKARFLQCLVKHGSQWTIDDDNVQGRDKSHEDKPSDVRGDANSVPDVRGPANSVPTPGPPTPVSIDVGGDLPTIAEDDNEDDNEDDADELALETFFAELMDV